MRRKSPVLILSVLIVALALSGMVFASLGAPVRAQGGGEETPIVAETPAGGESQPVETPIPEILPTQTPAPVVVDPAKSALKAEPVSLIADGIGEITVSVVAKDANDQPVAGKVIELARTIAGNADAVLIEPAQATTDANGVAIFKVKSAVIQTVELTVNNLSDGGSLGSVSVNFTPSDRDVDPSKSTLTLASDQALKANGLESFTVIATLRDSAGVVTQGKTATLELVGAPESGVTVSGGAPSGPDGVVTWTVTSVLPASFGFTANVGTGAIAADKVANFAPVVDVAKSTAALQEVAADALKLNTAATIVITLRDSDDKALGGLPVTVTSSRPSDVITAINAATDGSGQARFTVSVTESGPSTLTVVAGGVPLAPITVTGVVPPPPNDPNNSTVVALNPRVMADNVFEAQVVVTVRDSANNPVQGSIVTLDDGSASVTTFPSSVTTDVNGEAVFNTRSGVAQTATYTATINGTITVIDTATVDFALPDGTNSVLSATPLIVPSDGTSVSTVTVNVRDGSGNIIEGVVGSLDIVPPLSPSDVIPLTGEQSDASGNIIWQIRSPTAVTVDINAILFSNPGQVAVDNSVTVQFASTTTVDKTNSTVVAVNGAGTVNTGNGTPRQIQVTARAVDNSPLAGRTVTLSAAPGSGIVIAPSSATTNASGQADFTLFAQNAAVIAVTATADGVVLDDAADVLNYTFTAPVDAGQSTVNVGGGTPAVGSPTRITVTVRDAGGTVQAGQYVQLGSSLDADIVVVPSPDAPADASPINPNAGYSNASGVIEFDVTPNISGTHVLTTTAAGITLSSSSLVVPPAITSLTFTPITPKNTGEAFNAIVTFNDSGATGTIELLQGTTVLGTQTGTGSVTFTGVRLDTPGTITLRAQLQSNPSGVFTTTNVVVNAIVNAANSTVVPTTINTTVGAAGTTITVTVLDASSTALADQLVVPTLTGVGSIAPANQRTNASGVATFTYTPGSSAGTGTIDFTAGGITLDDTVSVTVAPTNIPTSANSFITNPASGMINTNLPISAFAFDASNNPVQGVTVTVTHTGLSGVSYTPANATMTTNAAGTGSITVRSTTAGTANFTATFDYGTGSFTKNFTIQFTGTTGTEPDLGIAKVRVGQLVQNAIGTYTITIANFGAATVGPITVSDTLPAQLTYVSASGTDWSCSNAGQAVTCTRTTSLANGTFSVITLQVRPNTAGVVTNTATVSTAGETNTSNNTSSDTSTVDSSTGLTVDPNFSTAVAVPTSVPADNTTPTAISVTVRNASNQPIVGATVTLQPQPNTGLTITASNPLVTDGSGLAVFNVRSSVNQTVTFTVLVTTSVSNVTLTQRPVVTFGTGSGTGVVSETNSTVISNYLSIPADSRTAATVTVTLRDTAGTVVSGKPVTLRVNPAQATVSINPPSGTSDANGVVTFQVTSSAQGSGTFSAEVTDGGRVIFITQTANIQFTAPGTTPQVNPNANATQVASKATLDATKGTIKVIPTGPTTGTVVAWRLRVRNGPSLEAQILGLLPYGQTVSIIAKDSRGAWYQIELPDNQTAWVSAYWVRVSRAGRRGLPVVNAPGTTPVIAVPAGLVPKDLEGIGVINTYLLRVRTGPGTNFQQIGLLREGTEILILGISPDRRWYLFQAESGTYWTSALYVKVRLVNGVGIKILENVPTAP